MTELRAQIRLRPTRIGFLVRPADKKSLRQIMRINACLWGGLYNPIIPVYDKTPEEWKEENCQLNGKEVTQGYIKFFDCDVYVEAQEGLIEKAGLKTYRGNSVEKKAVSLNEFFEKEYKDLYEPEFGQTVFDILHDTYISERRFQLRDDIPAIYSMDEDLFSEACIGCYPETENLSYFKKNYYGVYRPEEVKPTQKGWLKIYGNNCITPFSVTNKHFEVYRNWHNDPVIFIFDPSNSKDVIDLWNLRIEPSPVYPVPIKWLPDLAETLNKFIRTNYRPLKGNNHGVMHHVTAEKARSISEEMAKEMILPYFADLPKGSISIKYWRTPVWKVNYRNHFVVQPERTILSAKMSDQTIELKNDTLSGVFNTLSPPFSEQYSRSRSRWANVLQVSSPYKDAPVALSLPFNTFDRSWPFSTINEFACGREGWIFLQDYKSVNQYISFINHEKAFSSWLERINIKSSNSEAGRIARQVINSLGGFWGLHLIDDEETIQFINKHASSTRRRMNNTSGEVIEEDFSGRSASIDDWQAMIQRRKKADPHGSVDLSRYIEQNVIKVGLESECDHCGAKNWHGLDEVSYEVRCLRCLKIYKFPQGNLRKNNKNWRYRVVGPFAVPDYAQGAYTSLLTISFFANKRCIDMPSSYSTALFLDQKTEVDFALWIPEEKTFDINGEPRLIIGEAKSFGNDVIKESDLVTLKNAANLLSDSIIVISVLKKSFSDEEVKRLRKFVLWAREPVKHQPRHWVILLTGTELFSNYLEKTWKELGEPYSSFANYHGTRYLEQLSDATLYIYLGFDSYFHWLESRNKC